ncbi:MAG TPA: S8 family serine peptidase, partial [Actinomycetota bacterium]|nr:S8 family serine peptidase [Actinomycetota bacterium]
YQDFSGEGVNGVTGGEEAFGDVSSIAAQGNQTFDLSGEVNPAHPLPPGCTIRIQGVAPGASVAVMKVFGHTNAALNSVVLQGIDWAVTHDHVDILSESLGENPIPNPGTDPIAIADADAVAAGITVVASTGDAGPTNTISTPAVAPGVIAVGASTTYREYAQTSSYGYQFGGNGWESDNVSDVSSSGDTELGPNTIDVLAPGESGWADCSPNTAVFTECADIFNGPAPQPIVAFGGTSEAAPLTAGVAALVIQAYRSTHGGATPSPALVKQIIMSSAQDLGVPGNEEGAGLVDGLRAVQDAMSVSDSNGTPTVTGTGLLYSPNSISLTGQPDQSSVTPVTVSNTGTTTQTVTPVVRELGPPSTIAQGTLNLNAATDPTMVFQNGVIIGDVHLLHFTVPAGTQRLLSQIAWQTASQVTATVRETLFDPSGAIAAQSRPQGDGGGFGQVEVRDPSPGSWTMLTFDAGVQLTDAASVLAPYTGPLAYTITGASYRTVPDSVWPKSAAIAPGASATFNVRATAPSSPGDRAESLVFGSDAGTPGDPSLGSVPIVTRALVSVGHDGGRFSGTLTGGNDREPIYGQELIYQFDVPHAVHGEVLSVNVAVADPGYQVLGILDDPTFSPVDAQSTLSSVSAQNFQTLTLTWADPVPGRWTLDLNQILNVSSGVTAARVRGTISLGPPPAGAAGLPEGQRLDANSTVNATVAVTNDGTEPEAYSLDPRLDAAATIPLASTVTPTGVPLPVSNTATIPQFVVPPFTTGLEMVAQSTVPITMDTSPSFGIPDIEGVSSGDLSIVTLLAPDIPATLWSCGAAELGPFPGPAPASSYACGAAALTNSFDPGVDSDTGNLWSAL